MPDAQLLASLDFESVELHASVDQKKTTSTPPKKKASSTPPKKKANDAPPKKKASSTPPKKKANDAPPKKKASSTPPKKKANDAPPKKKSSSTPPKKKANDAPPKKKTSSTTPKKKANDAPPKKKASKDAPAKPAKKDAPAKPAPKKDAPAKPAKKDAPAKPAPKKDAPAKDGHSKPATDPKEKHDKDAPQGQTAKENHDKTTDAPVEHLVIEEPDSVLGSLFVEHRAPLASHVYKVEVPTAAIAMPNDSLQNAQALNIWNAEMRQTFHLGEEMPAQPLGIAGTPTEYQFSTDDAVTSTLLISFFLMAWVIASSWKFVRSQLRNFFINRERPNLFAEPDDNELRSQGFLIVQTCFLISLLFFTATRDYLPDVFTQVSPSILLLSSIGISLVYYGAKLALYSIVNHTFFTPAKCLMWNNIHFATILLTGCSLLPLVLLVVFFDIPFADITLACILLLSVIKTLLLFKCFRIFFSSLLGCVHLILYFCALEIIPLGIFAYSLYAASVNLLAL